MKHNILLVEDDHVIRSILFDMLCEYGYSVTSVANGHDAYAVFVGSVDGFDVVVSDYHMPGMYGDNLRKLIFAHCDDDSQARPAFIIMSGAWAPALGGDSKHDGFIAKPFDSHKLHDMIQRMVERRRAA